MSYTAITACMPSTLRMSVGLLTMGHTGKHSIVLFCF